METLFVSDPFHEKNHTTCSQSHMSTNYENLDKQNRESAEQFNSILRRIARSVSYMTPENYMRAITLFCVFNNENAWNQ